MAVIHFWSPGGVCRRPQRAASGPSAATAAVRRCYTATAAAAAAAAGATAAAAGTAV